MAGGDASGDKRKPQWKSGGQDNKRHKGTIACASTAKGASGILVTCDRTKERQSVRDALNLLNEAADKLFPKQTATDDAATAQQEDDGADADKAADGDDAKEDDASTVQKMLQEEIAALKADAKSRKTGRFTPLDTGVRGVLLIKILDSDISAVALVTKILEDVDATKEFPSRFINRMIPLEKIGYSTSEDIKSIAAPMVKQFITKFTTDDATKDTPIEYAVEIKRRNCTRLDTKEVIDALATMVGTDHKVNLTTPNVVILVEVFKNTFGVSVVTNFHQYRKYNVRSVIEPPVSSKQAAVKKEEKEEKEATEETEVVKEEE